MCLECSNNMPSLVQMMAWRRPGDKPLSEPMMVSLLTHICVTRPQWVNTGLHQRTVSRLGTIKLWGIQDLSVIISICQVIRFYWTMGSLQEDLDFVELIFFQYWPSSKDNLNFQPRTFNSQGRTRMSSNSAQEPLFHIEWNIAPAAHQAKENGVCNIDKTVSCQ